MSPSEKSKKLAPLRPVTNDTEHLRQFDRSLPMSLLKAREAVMKKFMPALKAHDLTAQQWRVIRALEQRGDMEVSELSDVCYILKPSMSRIVQNLQARGLIERRGNSEDRRRSTMALTDSGRVLFEKIAPASIERYQYITEKFGYGKLELLYELLDELVATLSRDDNKQDDDKE